MEQEQLARKAKIEEFKAMFMQQFRRGDFAARAVVGVFDKTNINDRLYNQDKIAFISYDMKLGITVTLDSNPSENIPRFEILFDDLSDMDDDDYYGYSFHFDFELNDEFIYEFPSETFAIEDECLVFRLHLTTIKFLKNQFVVYKQKVVRELRFDCKEQSFGVGKKELRRQLNHWQDYMKYFEIVHSNILFSVPKVWSQDDVTNLVLHLKKNRVSVLMTQAFEKEFTSVINIDYHYSTERILADVFEINLTYK